MPVHWCAYKDAKDNPAALKAELDWLADEELHYEQDVDFDMEALTGKGKQKIVSTWY